MQTAGIICEFNPFHEGHAYLIRQAKEQGADTVVALMSGDFVQRGEPAVRSKYDRTRQALEGGADLVFELPVRYALASAGDFALGGILALKSLGFVTDLYFGSECGDMEPLMALAKTLEQETDHFSTLLQEALKKGLSYPAARSYALSQCTDLPESLYSEPNNILGIEYCRAIHRLGASITPHTIRRQGLHYHDAILPDTGTLADSNSADLHHVSLEENNSNFHAVYPSATALRQKIYTEDTPHLCLNDCSAAIGMFLLQLQHELPQPSENGLLAPGNEPLAPGKRPPSHGNGLLSHGNGPLTPGKDLSPSLIARIKKFIPDYTSAETFIHDCQTRAFTESRIRRALLQSVIGIGQTTHTMPYLRLLGIKKGSGKLLKKLPESSSFHILTKLAADEKKLDAHARALLQTDIFASHWYRQMWQMKYGGRLPGEYQRSVILMEG